MCPLIRTASRLAQIEWLEGPHSMGLGLHRSINRKVRKVVQEGGEILLEPFGLFGMI